MPKPTPDLADETERLRKWREVRRRAAESPTLDRHAQASLDRETRLDAFEQDKAQRIRNAETRRRADAEGLEDRRMEKARAHLEALDDIETAKANLLAARQKSRRMALLLLAVFVGLPTLLTAVFHLFIAAPVYQATSILALETAQPILPRNPLFNDSTPYATSSMAPAFQLRARLYATAPLPRDFTLSIDTQQGLLTLSSFAPNAAAALALNQQIIATAPTQLTILAPAQAPVKPISRTGKSTLLTFLSSLAIFAISAVFIQSLLHHSRT